MISYPEGCDGVDKRDGSCGAEMLSWYDDEAKDAGERVTF